MGQAVGTRRKGPRAILRGLLGYLGIAGLCGVVLAGFGLPVISAASAGAKETVAFFDSLPEDLTVGEMSQQSRILYADGTTMARFYYENRVNVPLKQVSPAMQHAVIAIEDWRFYQHAGADLHGIARAIVNNLRGRDTQGASTLTQQWVRNVLLDQARARGDRAEVNAQLSPDKGRKIREIRLAIAAEKRFTKEQILTNYLNIAAFGGSLYGVETASQRYFSQHAAKLNVVDSALLAGMIQQPSRFNPLTAPKLAQARRDVVLGEMLRRKYITSAQYAAAKKVPVAKQLKPRAIPNGCIQAGTAAFFCDYVTKVVATDPVFGADQADRLKLLYRGGLTIRTTLSRSIQLTAQRTINEKGAAKASPGIGMSVVSVQPGTGRIVAMAQNRPYDPTSGAPKSSTAINYNVDRRMGGGLGFQTGSSYKPFTLAAWLDSGHSLGELVDSSRVNYNVARDFGIHGCDGFGGRWYPANAEGGGGGFISALAATYQSVNTAYAHMATKVDLCRIREIAESLGVHPAAGGELQANPSSVLGTNDIAPMTMAAAFAGFADDGIFCRPIAIVSATTPAGKSLGVPKAGCHQAIKAEVATGVNFALQKVLTQGTMRAVGGIGRPAAGKTGTTDGSSETWFVGYTPKQLSTAVWVGTPDRSPSSVNFREVGGRRYGHVFGATIAGATWQRYMSRAVANLPVTRFSPYRQSAELVDAVPVPRTFGMTVAQAQYALAQAGFSSYVAGAMNSNAPKGLVAGTSPWVGHKAPSGAPIGIYLSNGPAPKPSPSPSGGPSAGPTAAPSASPPPGPRSTPPAPRPTATATPVKPVTPSVPGSPKPSGVLGRH